MDGLDAIAVDNPTVTGSGNVFLTMTDSPDADWQGCSNTFGVNNVSKDFVSQLPTSQPLPPLRLGLRMFWSLEMSLVVGINLSQ